LIASPYCPAGTTVLEAIVTLQQTVPAPAVPPATTAAEVDALRDPGASLILRDLTEKVTAYESNNADPTGKTPTENDFATVSLDIFAPSGELIGHTTGAGRMLFKQEHDGHFVAYFGEEITLNDGNVIRAGGLVDDARLTAGEWATFPAVVISGPFAGAIGYRQFRPVKDETHAVYTSSIVVYKR
jgi:hypothetical protein